MRRVAVLRDDELTFQPWLSGDTVMSLDEWHSWWADRHDQGSFSVRQIPFRELRDWQFDPSTGNLGHTSGRFFTIEGLVAHDGVTQTWSQPIINQPEIGILGIVVKFFGGVLHCLMQAKMEPGNINTLQLSPTVQATRSNYMQVHKGSSTRYLEYFVGAERGRVLVDVLQSEQGAWFWRKRNRNVVVLVNGDVPLHEDYCWLSLSQVGELANIDNLLNMDARTVLSCLPFALPADARIPAGGVFGDELLRSYQHQTKSLHTMGQILSWFIEAKTRCEWSARLVPLDLVGGWSRNDYEIADHADKKFRIIAVDVEAGTREVRSWRQPLLYPRGTGRAVFVLRRIDDVLHVLVRANPEYGLMDMVEMAPTVHLLPGEDVSELREDFLRDVLTADTTTVHYDHVLSEEGGRFHHAETRYQLLEPGDDFPLDVPSHLCWMTVRQLMDLLRHGHYLNVEARSLLSCIHSFC